ncbi:MAG: bifunctional diaminohydroxyphosphoribosylaminopyrimidine deaminase/5-amino-6-(5-phosphoribosylamino)uracil reductase RibD [Alphaproteobacteria bacterium]|nr:bifunctional diaminohydroxyphosphoribosylaminopyrimidine deaminase/5-amino-6-(5-phosphoribosylamino)uracil reductase RibD [Alphaproteobacteria bacterium]
MQRAAEEGRRWLGATSPNPPVGAAALDENGNILAVAAHKRAGEDHAEAALLKLCREQNSLARVHTLCVTLEPCNHHGRTPPCSEAIIEAGIRHVAIGVADPNPRVAGGGAARLREAGITVTENIESDLCHRLIHAFEFHARAGRPFVTVKRAFDASGSMIPPAGQKTFSSPDQLTLAHRLRKKADAILTGSGTILADNPLFTVRNVPDFDKNRVLGVFDRRNRVSQAWFDSAATRNLLPIRYFGLDEAFSDLQKRSVQDVLVETGPVLSESILESPFWTLLVDIHAGEPDKLTYRFNPEANLPFNTNTLDIDSLLLL